MSNTQRVVIINGSPRATEASTSEFLSQLAEKKFTGEGAQVQRIIARKSLKEDPQRDFDAMRMADTVIFVFPLYFFCTPGLLIRFLQDFAAYLTDHPGRHAQRVYAVVNCGFPEPDINAEAIRVIESFSRHIGAEFGFGVGIGGGGMLYGTKDAPFMKPLFAGLDSAFSRMVQGSAGDNVMLAIHFPRRLYFVMGNFGWKQMAHQNGLKKRELYKRPYVQR